jgi:Zn-dependent M28 family amino/carboxypeptidase
MAVTCEEKGLLGSSWYVKHPLVPLEKTVLNINCDGVGYNDKTRVTSISLGRTNRDDLLKQAASAYKFSLGGDPDPSEGFYERSDQVSFAREGVPAIKLQPGLAKMDEDIFKYYHRPADEFGSLDMNYLTQFYRTFAFAVHLISNDSTKPAWVAGDKFEEAAKKLYK